MLVSFPLQKVNSPLNPLNKEQASKNYILPVRTPCLRVRKKFSNYALFIYNSKHLLGKINQTKKINETIKIDRVYNILVFSYNYKQFFKLTAGFGLPNYIFVSWKNF